MKVATSMKHGFIAMAIAFTTLGYTVGTGTGPGPTPAPSECPGPVQAVIERGSCANNCNADHIVSQGGCLDTSACFLYDCFNWQDAWTAHTYTISWLFGIPGGVCNGCTVTYSVPTTATNGYPSSAYCGA